MKYEYLKGSEKDFEGAPEWAKYLVGIPGSSDRAFVEAICLGGRHQFTDSLRVSQNSDLHEPENHYVIAERRPITEPVWDGEGLPPVGCGVEVKRAIDWMHCKILFISEAHVVLLGEEECCWQTQACQFRKIRTEAERKREDAIQAMYEVVSQSGYGTPGPVSIYDAIAAGKITGVTLSGK